MSPEGDYVCRPRPISGSTIPPASRCFCYLPIGRENDEGCASLKMIFKHPADIILDDERNVLMVSLNIMAGPRSNRLLRMLCERVNQSEDVFPGTTRKIFFEAPDAAFGDARGQEF